MTEIHRGCYQKLLAHSLSETQTPIMASGFLLESLHHSRNCSLDKASLGKGNKTGTILIYPPALPFKLLTMMYNINVLNHDPRSAHICKYMKQKCHNSFATVKNHHFYNPNVPLKTGWLHHIKVNSC